MPTTQLTDAAVRRLKTPTDVDRIEYWDTKTPGFGIRISSSGVRSWVMLLRILRNGEWVQQRLTLGRYPGVTLAQAREKAIQARGQAEQGEDPGASVRAKKTAKVDASRHTFAFVRTEFLTKYRGRQNRRPAPATLAQMTRVLNADLFADWEERPLEKVTRRDVMDSLDVLMERGAEVMANRTLAYLGMFFGWALHRGIIQVDPTEGVKKPGAEQSRARVLSSAELAAIWQAIADARDGDLFAAIVQVLMLTGQRREEVAGMRWAELDLSGAIWTLPEGNRTKNHREHMVPLSAPVLAILRERQAEQVAMGFRTEYVFVAPPRERGLESKPYQGWSKAKARLDARASIAPWTLHDLRRTLATRMAEDLRIAPHVIEALLNHVSGTRSGVAGIYNRALYLEERKGALETWARYLAAVVGDGEADNVVEMRANG
ncbi:tyrosine-type recombinase/integrase [Thiocystis minor]|uniref:tyrosine-type recombinase/integrase n=1 Tax=Thiocystis minor TaxID=61597 RepID=UPI001912751B|nr:site-specific integrase [Thiocystis minor]